MKKCYGCGRLLYDQTRTYCEGCEKIEMEEMDNGFDTESLDDSCDEADRDED